MNGLGWTAVVVESLVVVWGIFNKWPLFGFLKPFLFWLPMSWFAYLGWTIIWAFVCGFYTFIASEIHEISDIAWWLIIGVFVGMMTWTLLAALLSAARVATGIAQVLGREPPNRSSSRIAGPGLNREQQSYLEGLRGQG